MEITEEQTQFCPYINRSVIITESWMIDNGYGCAVSAELLSLTCSNEGVCLHGHQFSCLLCLLETV